MGDEQPALCGLDLTRTFGSGLVRMTALHQISVGLCRRQFALIMGPSGSGKTTLLAVLSGLLRPDNGQVLALGEDMWRLSDQQRKHFRLRHCGFIFQGYNLFPALTARQQLEIVLHWGQGESGREVRRKTDAVLALLGLAEKSGLRPGQLSGGEQQRVAIGRALVKQPAFCFADEPTSALDWAHGQQVVELLRRAAHDRGAMILVVSHDTRIIPFADRVFHLKDGSLTEPASGAKATRSNAP
jgi:putative ABC transport system ATP-binding protein